MDRVAPCFRSFVSRCVLPRWFVQAPARAGQFAGRLYAANTGGAAIGTLAAGFLLIPAIGVTGTVLVAVTASALAIGAVIVIARRAPNEKVARRENVDGERNVQHKGHKGHKGKFA